MHFDLLLEVGFLWITTLVLSVMTWVRLPAHQRGFSPGSLLDVVGIILVLAGGLFWVRAGYPLRLEWEIGPILAIVCLGVAIVCWAIYGRAWDHIERFPEHLRVVASRTIRADRLPRWTRAAFLLATFLLLDHAAGVQDWRWALWIGVGVYIIAHLAVFGTEITRVGMRLPRGILPSEGRGHDVFISYRSTDANEVRRVVECLLGARICVWFAEFEILFLSRDLFQPAINAGIDGCSTGVIFANDEHAASPHCRNEVVRLLAQGKRIIVVPLGTAQADFNAVHGKALAAHATAHPGRQTTIPFTSPETTAAEIARELEVETSPFPVAPPTPGTQWHRVTWHDVEVRFPTDGWEAGEPENAAQGDVARSPGFRRSLWPVLGYFSVTVGPYASLPSYHAANLVPSDHDLDEGEFLPSLSATTPGIDDREQYNDLRDLAQVITASRAHEVGGLHLYFHSDTSHLLLTYWNGTWHRRYDLVLPHPVTRRPVAVVVTFHAIGTFGDVCLHTGEMDWVVNQLRLGPRTTTSTPSVTGASLSEVQRRTLLHNIFDCPPVLPLRSGDAVELVNWSFAAVEQAHQARGERDWVACYEAARNACVALIHALRLNPTLGEAYNELGYILRNLGHYDLARKAYRRALGCDDGNPKFHNNLLTLDFEQVKLLTSRTAVLQEICPVVEQLAVIRNAWPDYPSTYFLAACILAYTNPNEATRYEAAMASGARLYHGACAMPSGLAVREDRVVATMMQNIVRCLVDAKAGRLLHAGCLVPRTFPPVIASTRVGHAILSVL